MKITPKKVRKKIEDLDLSYSQVFRTLGLNKSWFYKMIKSGASYTFSDPNPEWMALIWDYLVDYEAFQKRWKSR